MSVAVDSVGWAAAIVGVASGLPQLVKLVRTRDVGGLELLPWQAGGCGSLAWAIVGIVTARAPLIVPNLLSTAINLAVAVMIVRQGRIPWFRAYGVTIIIFSAIMASYPLQALFGVLSVIVTFAGWGAQLIDIARYGRPSGLAVPAVATMCLSQVLWLIYGLITGTVAMTVGAAMLTTVLGLVVLFALARRKNTSRDIPTFTGAMPVVRIRSADYATASAPTGGVPTHVPGGIGAIDGHPD